MFFSKDSLTDEHYRAIGLIAAEWSALEVSLEAAIIQYAAEDWESGRILSVEMGNVARTNAIIALARLNMERANSASANHITPEQFWKLQKLFSKIDGLRVRRNDAVHAYWIPPEHQGAETTQHMKVSAKRTLKAELRPLGLADLVTLAEDIAATHHEFRDFFADELAAYYFL